jgi:cation:H+ antiporter
MGVTLLKMAFAMAAIYFACDYFTNGVEWLGRRLRLSQTATGSLLAAFGTALPESVVTLSAAAFGSGQTQKDIGVGAAIGGPLALSTIGYGVIAVLALRDSLRARSGSGGVLSLQWLLRDQAWFLLLFAAATMLGMVELNGKFLFGLLFIAAFVIYALRELSASSQAHELSELAVLAIRPDDPEPKEAWIWLQLGLSLSVIFVASRAFVGELELVGTALGLAPQVTALLISPIATEMPETINSMFWVRQGKIALALANISGAMMIQATIPAAFGMIFTPWLFEAPIIVAASVTLLATAAAFSFIYTREAVWAG